MPPLKGLGFDGPAVIAALEALRHPNAAFSQLDKLGIARTPYLSG